MNKRTTQRSYCSDYDPEVNHGADSLMSAKSNIWNGDNDDRLEAPWRTDSYPSAHTLGQSETVELSIAHVLY